MIGTQEPSVRARSMDARSTSFHLADSTGKPLVRKCEGVLRESINLQSDCTKNENSLLGDERTNARLSRTITNPLMADAFPHVCSSTRAGERRLPRLARWLSVV
jgi:hypothetical protein